MIVAGEDLLDLGGSGTVMQAAGHSLEGFLKHGTLHNLKGISIKQL